MKIKSVNKITFALIANELECIIKYRKNINHPCPYDVAVKHDRLFKRLNKKVNGKA